jgi:hypothetical protein
MAEYTLDTSLSRETWQQLDAFTRGYITAAMWTLTDDDGEPCDHLGLHDVAPETIAQAIADCRAFQEAHRADLDEATDEQKDRTDESHGHDFWLTRNGHGTGFWDRGYSAELGETLTRAAKAFGSVDWYVGDDGNVYQM